MKIILLGNGPSRDIYTERENYRFYEESTVVVGCNIPPPDVQVYASVFADAYAAKLLRPKGGSHGDKYGKFKVVLGERADRLLEGIKGEPGSARNLKQKFEDDKILLDVIRYPDVFRKDQRYLSSGHIAFYWICQKFENPSIHMFGFDSLFTGDHLASYSNRDIRAYDSPHIDRHILDKPRESALIWEENWRLLFKEVSFESAVVYGYEGDPELPFDDPRIHEVKVKNA